MSRENTEQSSSEVFVVYARVVRELDDAQHAYMDEPSEDTFKRFWIARERYQVLTRRIDQDWRLADATEAYSS
jgi:hypothetical protein